MNTQPDYLHTWLRQSAIVRYDPRYTMVADRLAELEKRNADMNAALKKIAGLPDATAWDEARRIAGEAVK